MSTPDVQSQPPLPADDGRGAVVGRYPLRTDAYDHALVVSSMEIEHWILHENDEFLLCVEPQHADAVRREIEAWERQRRDEPPPSQQLPDEGKHAPASLFVAGWTMAIFFLIQNRAPNWWDDAGASSSTAVLRGEWWRVITALTLHADFAHVGANVAAGLVYAAFLLPIFGGGWTWLGIVLSGALGNWLNAWGHRGETHISIGASTAVFGALGILVGAQCMARIFALRRVRIREVLVPVGAGLALLAYLGTGGAQTDFSAHLCGLLVGIPLGALGVALRLKKRTPRVLQILLGLLALATLALAWLPAALARHL